MNEFKMMWEDQKRFNERIIGDKDEMTEEEFQQCNNFYTLALHREVSEVLEETAWKIHRDNSSKTMIKSNICEELVDVLKYWMSLCQLHGFSAEDMIDEYFRKSQVVEQRFYQEKEIDLDGRKVVGVDIDGVLAQYPKSLIDFVNEQKGTCFTVDDVTSYDIFSDLGIDFMEGKELRHQYRESGKKKFIEAYPEASYFLKKLKQMGYVVVLLTARPYEKYKRIFADTQYWLRSNELEYDMILWDENKGERLVKEFGAENIEFFVDDVAKNANDISDMGIKCYLINKAYNEHIYAGENVVRVDDLNEVYCECLLQDIYKGG
jgi:uncharacterized HAD superfamily protein